MATGITGVGTIAATGVGVIATGDGATIAGIIGTGIIVIGGDAGSFVRLPRVDGDSHVSTRTAAASATDEDLARGQRLSSFSRQ
jgi:hypothetical protein